MKYIYAMHYVSGKELYTTDALSKAKSSDVPSKRNKDLKKETASFVHAIMKFLPTTKRHLQAERGHQKWWNMQLHLEMFKKWLATKKSHQQHHL